jgi:hypothetical protein
MSININQLTNKRGCTVHKNKYGFHAEISLRKGKYKVLVEYLCTDTVHVYLITPEIIMEDYGIIHTYGMHSPMLHQKKLLRLCLTVPSKNEWSPTVPLLESYIPWAAEWTEFYELWLLTGVWHGGGEHPGTKREEIK